MDTSFLEESSDEELQFSMEEMEQTVKESNYDIEETVIVLEKLKNYVKSNGLNMLTKPSVSADLESLLRNH